MNTETLFDLYATAIVELHVVSGLRYAYSSHGWASKISFSSPPHYSGSEINYW